MKKYGTHVIKCATEDTQWHAEKYAVLARVCGEFAKKKKRPQTYVCSPSLWSTFYLLVVSVLTVVVAESVLSCFITIVSALPVVLSCLVVCPQDIVAATTKTLKQIVIYFIVVLLAVSDKLLIRCSSASYWPHSLRPHRCGHVHP